MYISVFVILSLLLSHLTRLFHNLATSYKIRYPFFYDVLQESRRKNGVNADGHPDCKTSVFLLPFLSHKILPQSGDKWGFLTYFCLYLSFFVFVIARLFVLALSLKILSRSGDKRAFLQFVLCICWNSKCEKNVSYFGCDESIPISKNFSVTGEKICGFWEKSYNDFKLHYV